MLPVLLLCFPMYNIPLQYQNQPSSHQHLIASLGSSNKPDTEIMSSLIAEINLKEQEYQQGLQEGKEFSEMRALRDAINALKCTLERLSDEMK
jgi:hypothetical protein